MNVGCSEEQFKKTALSAAAAAWKYKMGRTSRKKFSLKKKNKLKASAGK